MIDPLGWILAIVHDVDPITRTLLAAAGMFCETTILIGLLIPGDTIVLVASTGVSNPAEYLGMLVAVIVGSLAGESVGYALGWWFGHRIRASRLGRRLGEANWVRAEQYVDRRGGIAIFVSRFLPVLHSLVPLTVGMSELRYRRFIAWTAPACVIWATAYVTVGTLAAGGYRQLSSQLHWAGYLFGGVVLAFFAAVLLIRRAIERREARHWNPAATPETPPPTAPPAIGKPRE
ncbi:DedA family protein [Lysinimonas soli]|uniref:DedA family protein n=1 Tax=Lysinimonas soli TaxID=1074233 RepID=A0ABW0NRP2_9MICO